MADINWTPAQRQAIETVGGDLLVSAAAGSGKTAVLTERAVRLMMGDEPVYADRLLIATFTNAAAGEMRRRIRQRLMSLLSQQPDDPLLRRQIRLLDSAQIGTVHAFCQRLLRHHFEALDIPPNFRLLSEEEGKLHRLSLAEQVVAEAYEGGDPVFFELVELLSGSRDDRKVAETLLSVYASVSAHPFYHHWMDQKLALYADTGEHNVWQQALLDYARSALSYCADQNAQLTVLCAGDEKLEKGYLPALLDDRALIDRLSRALEQGSWDGLTDAFGALQFARLGSVRGEILHKEDIKAGRDIVKKTLNSLADYFKVRQADIKADIADLLPKIAGLFDLVKRFDRAYTQLKRERGVLDFTDLEQLTVELLIHRQPDGSLVPTDLAAEVRSRFDAVMVDEYQDINAVQDAIFKAVSRGDNLFMVGDVKQSIYRFRQASPELFIEKMERFSPVGQGFPALIRLPHNFRSRPEITAAVNGVFRLLMSREVGEIDYTPEEYLQPVESPPTPLAAAELILIDSGLQDEEDSALTLEADYVAAHIRDLIRSGVAVKDGEGSRPIRPGDIALLLAAPRTSGLAFVRALEAAGVPVVSNQRSTFLGSYEIAPVVGLLRALDNPLRSVDLASAMLSPLFGLTPDHLARLRTTYKRDSLIAGLQAAAGAGEAPFVKTLALFSKLRRTALSLTPYRLLTEIYAQTGYEVAVGMMAGGDQRLANLHLLVDYAAGQTDRGCRSLSDFVGYLDQLTERGQDLNAAAVGSREGVAVLSIHQSKGLEFPVVYLCHLGKKINREDLRQRTILHPDYGFASVRRDPVLRIQYDSLPYLAVKLESERALMSEELRKLYVAMTRARDRLIMTCTLPEPQNRLLGSPPPLTVDGRLPPYRVRSAASVADWLTLCLPHCEEALTHRVVHTFDRQPDKDAPQREHSGYDASYDADLVAELARRADFCYPYASSVGVPAKLSVSQLTKTDLAARFLRRPVFMQPAGLSPTERGNAVHLFMQLCDYKKAAADPGAELARLLAEGLLSRPQHDAVDLERIRAFFAGELGRRILNSPRVLREYEFVAPAGAELVKRYLPDLVMGEEPMMVQGIADCIFFEGKKAVLVDYKTDYVSQPEALIARYAPQLSAYRALLSPLLEAEIAQSYLYAFHLDRAIELT